MSEPTLKDFLIRCQKVTDVYTKSYGRWTLQEQIAHVHSEVSEVYQARKHHEGDIRELEEISDVILSGLTLFAIVGADEEAIMQALLDKLSVIEQRTAKLESKGGPTN